MAEVFFIPAEPTPMGRPQYWIGKDRDALRLVQFTKRWAAGCAVFDAVNAPHRWFDVSALAEGAVRADQAIRDKIKRVLAELEARGAAIYWAHFDLERDASGRWLLCFYASRSQVRFVTSTEHGGITASK